LTNNARDGDHSPAAIWADQSILETFPWPFVLAFLLLSGAGSWRCRGLRRLLAGFRGRL